MYALALFMWYVIEMGIEIGIECLNECLIEGHISKWEWKSPLIEDEIYNYRISVYSFRGN